MPIIAYKNSMDFGCMIRHCTDVLRNILTIIYYSALDERRAEDISFVVFPSVESNTDANGNIGQIFSISVRQHG